MCFIDLFLLFLVAVGVVVVPVQASYLAAECGGELHNVDSGEIAPPERPLSEPCSCTWILAAPPRHKLLVNIEFINLANENDTLAFYVDGREYNIPRTCEKCWSNIVGEVLKVSFESAGLGWDDDAPPNGTTEVDLHAQFLIAYKAFNPDACGHPAMPVNGLLVGRNRTRGSKVRYRCMSPYELVGSTKSTCILLEDSPVPVWDNEPPKCVIPDCNGKVFNRTADKGVIVHPGYPAKTVFTGQHCEWDLRTPGLRRVVLNIKSFSLPMGDKKNRKNGGSSSLDLYDGDRDNFLLRLRGQEAPRVVTSTTNRLVMVLHTDNSTRRANDAGGSFGFYIEYSSTCESLDAPKDGTVNSTGLTVGSNATFSCSAGHELDGNEVLFCLPHYHWSSVAPLCRAAVPDDDVSDSTSGFTSPDTTATTEEVPPVNGSHVLGIPKGNRKSDLPSHQSTNGKNFDNRPDKAEETSKFLSASNEVHSKSTKNQWGRTSDSKDVDEFNDFMIIVIAAAVAVPIAIGCVLVGVCLWYRKQYPVRMAFGRKFETFENPVYEKRKRMAASPVVPTDPAELQRLTFLPSP